MFDRHALEKALLESKEAPRPRIAVPHALAIPALLQDTDMLSIVPQSLAVALTKRDDLVCRKLTYQTRTSTMRAIWHSRDEHETGHIWLREMVVQAARGTEKAFG